MNKTGSLDLIKKLNRSLVLEMIRNDQPISRAVIARKLGLSRSTVTMIVNDLIAKKFVVELGFGDSTKEGGRRGVELGFNPESGYGIGVDVGRAEMLIVMTDLDGTMVSQKRVASSSEIPVVIQSIKTFIEQSGIEESLILGMGIGLPGIVNSHTGTVLDMPILEWEGINLIEQIQPAFRFPVYVNNDVNCAALGERWLGGEDKTDHMLFIAIGEGVGSAIITGGELLEGYRYSAGEINALIDREDVRKGRITSKEGGAFEEQISATALSRSGYNPPELFQEYKKGNPEAAEIVEEFILYLSITIANAVSLINPQKVIIGGVVSQSLDVVIDQIRERVLTYTPIPADIELADLGGNAGALGAVAYVFEKLQQEDEI